MTVATPIADMITEMLKNCIPMEMIIVAVRSMERAVSTRQGVDETAEKRRLWDREYRRKRREHPPDQPDIHPTPPDVGNNALSFLREDKEQSKVVSKERKKERGCKIPPDWIPKQKHYDEGAQRGMTRADVDERAVRMREWCEANANRSITTKANWDSAFMGAWLKETKNGHGSNGYRTNPNASQSGSAAIVAGVAAAAERRGRERRAGGSGREAPGTTDPAGEPDFEFGGTAPRGNA